MKAIQFQEFGASDKLQMVELEKPTINEGEVLIRNKATSINPVDMKIRSCSMQDAIPVTLPFVPGLDVAGVVVAIGKKVTRFAIGDEVFARAMGGSYAEYIALDEIIVAKKPSGISFNEAAALATTLTTAYTTLVDIAQLQPGQKVLIHGAAGGVGTVMTQMAKSMGAYVTGTATGSGLELLHTLGADEIIDYKSQDFSTIVHDMDLVVDLVGSETHDRSYAVVKKGGMLLSTTTIASDAAKAKWPDITVAFVFSKADFIKLEYGANLVAAGKIQAQIARVMPLEKAADAQDLVSGGGIHGKLVLEIN